MSRERFNRKEETIKVFEEAVNIPIKKTTYNYKDEGIDGVGTVIELSDNYGVQVYFEVLQSGDSYCLFGNMSSKFIYNGSTYKTWELEIIKFHLEWAINNISLYSEIMVAGMTSRNGKQLPDEPEIKIKRNGKSQNTLDLYMGRNKQASKTYLNGDITRFISLTFFHSSMEYRGIELALKVVDWLIEDEPNNIDMI